MGTNPLKKAIPVALFALAAWLGIQYVLPVAMPFLLGGLLAFAAEPAVSYLSRKWGLKRPLAACLGVAGTLVFGAAVLVLLGALTLRELTRLADRVPDLESTALQGLSLLRTWCCDLAEKAPDGVRPVLTRAVDGVFTDSSRLADQVALRIPGFLSSVLGSVPTGAVAVGTGLLAAFMVSSRLPKLRAGAAKRIPKSWSEKYFPLLRQVRHSLGGWLRAQALLSGVTFLLVAGGFLLLRIPNGILWAVLITLMDAVPMLGTGVALVPWAVVCLLQGEPFQAMGLLAIFGGATIARTTLEPRLVGRQLGLDPLVTLAALYVGFRLWGFWGLLAAPVLTATAKALWDARTREG